MTHAVVYADPSMYAGWPANHGAWQWGDEFLVGFMRGPYIQSGMHNINQPFERVQARSRDGGRSWGVETHSHNFESREGDVLAPLPSGFSMDGYIARFCGVYDHGGDYNHARGGVYVSEDRGHSWTGPHEIEGLNLRAGEHCTTRTACLGDLCFITHADEQCWGSDYPVCYRVAGGKFEEIGVVTREPLTFRNAMPAVAHAADGSIVVLTRCRRGKRIGGWVQSYRSTDGGRSFEIGGEVGETGGENGNPPAVVTLPDGTMLAAFANRSRGAICAARSIDGVKWEAMAQIASGGLSDIGYPRLLLRSDGVAICVYYWADRQNTVQHIAASEVA